MEKSFVFVSALFALMVLVILSGCPINLEPVAPVETNEVAPVVAEVAPTVGGFTVGVDLGLQSSVEDSEPAEKVAEKGWDKNSIYEEMKLMAAVLKVVITTRTGEYVKDWTAPVVNGRAVCYCSNAPVGQYAISAELVDGTDFELFSGSDWVDIKGGGITNKISLYIHPLPLYLFSFQYAVLQGSFAKNTPLMNLYVKITEESGRVSQGKWDFDASTGIVTFTAGLPLDFQGGTMEYSDSVGGRLAIAVPAIPLITDWTSFEFGVPMYFDNSGIVDIDVHILNQ